MVVCHRLFIESQAFTKFVGDYLDDEEYSALQMYMLDKPINQRARLFVGLGEFGRFDGTYEEGARAAV